MVNFGLLRKILEVKVPGNGMFADTDFGMKNRCYFKKNDSISHFEGPN